ncbi:expressed unknown protein [Seminavis robusta]|uniref:Uncharacterized protein n=1 Tax=Seminavis robusta TaxID=568900 RepID=A0A9N8ELF1_9STRA|nr:expressed unknown protein [Seminavis robusta]|eukprot:Sro1277_g258710.1 n/a (1147) ;mRNA; f:23534-26974
MDLVWFEMTYGFDSPAWNPSVEEVDAVVCFTNDWMRDRVVAYLGQDEITGRNVFRRQAVELRVVSHYMDWDLAGDDQLVVTLFAYIQDKSNGEVVDPSTSFRAFELTSEDATAYVTNYVWNIVDTNNLFYYTNRIEVRARLNEPIPSNDEIKLQKSICEKDETRSPTASPIQAAQATPAPTSLPAQDTTPESPAGPPDNENNNPSPSGVPGGDINFPPLPDTNPTSSTSSTPEPATPPTSAPTAQETTAETPQQPTTGAPTTDTPTESPTDRPTTLEPTAAPIAVVPESTPEPTTGTSSTQPPSVAPPTATDTTETTATDDDTNTNNNADSNSNNEESPSETAAPATTPTTNDNPSFVIGGPNNNNQDESTASQGGPPATDGTTISTVAWRMVFHWPQTTTMTDIIREPTRTEMVHVLCQFQRFLEKRLEQATQYAPIAVELTEATWKLSNATSMVVNFVSNSYYVLSEEGGLYDHVPPNVVVASMQQDEQIQEQQYLMGYIRNETTTGNNNNVIDNIVHEATHLEIQPWALCSKLPPGRLRVAVCSAKTLVDPSADILGIRLDLETIPSEFEGYGQELLGPRPCEARTSPPRNSTNGSGGGSDSDSDDEREMYNTRAPLAYQDVQKRAYRLEVSFTVSNLDGITSPTDVNRTGLDVAFPWFVAGLMEEFYGGSVGRRYLRVGRNLYDGPVRLSYVQNSAWVDSIESMDCIGDNVHPDLICHQVLGVYSLVADPIRITRRALQASQQQTVTAGNTPWQVLVLQETYKRIHDGTFYGVLKTKAPETPLLIGTIPPPESGGGMGALYALMAVCIALALCICCLVRMLMLSKQRREEEWKRRLSRQKSKLNLNDDDDLSTTSKQRPNKRKSKKHDDDDQKASNKTIDTTGSTNPSTPTEFMDEDAVLAYYEDLAQDEDIDSNPSDDRKQEKDKKGKDAASETETDTENNYKNVSMDEDWGDSNDKSDNDDESSITEHPDYEQMKVSDLQKLCQAQGISTAGMFEKREMVNALQALNSKSGSSTALNVGSGGVEGEPSNANAEIPDYEQMKVSELRKLCQAQGISTAGMFEKREMVDALQALNSKSNSTTPNSGRGGMGGESSNGDAEIPDFDQLKVSELRKLCQAQGISTAGMFEKREMVDALQAKHGT